jgi:replicative DNA helicase
MVDSEEYDGGDEFKLADVELERVVLGQITGHGSFPMYESAGLIEDAFFRKEHRQIFLASQALHREGAVADIVTVHHRDRSISPSYLAGLSDGVPRALPENASYMTSKLMTLFDARACYYAAIDLHESLGSSPTSVDDAVHKHLQVLDTARRRSGHDTDRYDAAAQLQAYRDSFARDEGRVYFGVPALDEIVGGVRRGEVCGIMARPGVGKTLFMGHLMGLAANSNVETVMFSLEMPVDQIVSRLARSVYDVGRSELESAAKQGALEESTYRDTYNPLVVIDTPGLSMADIERRVRVEDKPQLVLIDHLGLVGGYRGSSTYDRVSAIARDTKEMAKRTGCAVVIAVQVSREAGGDGSRELSLGAARDSGIIEEVMDYLVALRRPGRRTGLNSRQQFDYRDIMLLSLLKNRHGEVGLEAAVEMDPVSLRLTPRPSLQLDESLENIGRFGRGAR